LVPGIWGYTAATGIIKDPTTGTQFVASSNPADPNYSPACTSSATCPNVIPVARVSKNGLGILNAWPVPNLTVPINNNNWTFFAPHPQNQRKDTLSLDWNITDNQRVRFRRMNYAWFEYHTWWGNQAVFDPQFYDPSQAVTLDPNTGLIIGTPTLQQLYNGMAIPGHGFSSDAKNHVPEANTTQWNFLFRGVSNHYSDIQWNDIQPRLGVAYQVNDKTVVRAGAGRFYTRLGVSDSVFLGGNPPFQPSASLTNGSVDALGPNAAAAIPLVVTTQSKNFRNPEAWNWNASFER
jgi:hypothetical protein